MGRFLTGNQLALPGRFAERAASPQPRGAAAASRAEAVRRALAELPEAQRVVIHLHRFERLSIEQIAEVLGEDPEAVRSRARAAYQRLQVTLMALLR